MLDDATLAKMVQAIVEKTDPDRVYLFGSRARGDARIDSDVDLMSDTEHARLLDSLARGLLG